LKPTGIRLREESPADAEFLYQLYASTRAAEMAAVPWDDGQKEAFLRWQFQLQSAHYHEHYPRASYLVIADGELPIGRLYIDRASDAMHVLDIALVPGRRGAGIGAALLKDLLEEAGSASRPVMLYVEQYNPALAFYERLGFQRVEVEGVYWLMRWSTQDSGPAIAPEARQDSAAGK